MHHCLEPKALLPVIRPTLHTWGGYWRKEGIGHRNLPEEFVLVPILAYTLFFIVLENFL